MQNKKSEKELSSWPATTKSFERVHIDFYEFGKHKFLIFVDDYSKWLEVIPMNSTIASITIDKLKSIFSIQHLVCRLKSFRTMVHRLIHLNSKIFVIRMEYV